MRFIHSLWTKPSLNDRWNYDAKTATISNIWYYALSVAYIKKLGQDIVLYTDSLGKECLDYLPYDEIYPVLDDVFDNDSTPVLWSRSKYYALDQEPLGALHIDGDVFIKSENCINKIEQMKYDILCQGIQEISLWNIQRIDDNYEANEALVNELKLPDGVRETPIKSFNTGIVSFNNKELKDKFISVYFNMVDQITSNEKIMKAWEENKNINLDLVIEQRFLYDLSEKYNIKYLLDYTSRTINADANAIGYQHVMGKKKYEQIDICKQVLQLINNEIYEDTLLKTEEIKQKYFNN
jgi:hypothetical protein